ncbi:interferon-induced GTP-binding protein Mx2 [Xylariaceae sp. FL0594]|nr:interferon-induced GTP-binding protein Mx2 [Xylariaceae sp. FL0594]
MAPKDEGLGNQAHLAKIDKLRELNVGSIIPLPQLVVVGDQSSGKSSVLESLTGFAFPRAAGLCTRYATQITCRRDAREFVSISIIPRPNADEGLKAKLLAFQRELKELDNDHLAQVFQDANTTMGLRMGIEGSDAMTCEGAFSEDILKIEISGQNQYHLTVIDVPGIFRVATPGLTTESDVLMVRNMVKRYMHDKRTIILAVMPCNVDIATQEILKMAEEEDPDGVRTMGVLTKPDLASEKATQDAIMDLILGRRNPLKLGYCVVKNRSADDETSTLNDRRLDEKAFFTAPPWSDVNDRCGVVALQNRLRGLLMEISKRELPNVKFDIDSRLRACRAELEAMGPARSDYSSQRLYLAKVASKFHDMVQCALNGYYAEDELFTTAPELKLATIIMEMNEKFSDIVLRLGHKQRFKASSGESETAFACETQESSIPIPINWHGYRELDDIIVLDEYECPKPLKGPVEGRVEEIYRTCRGPEIGTFNGTILATAFREQSEKWESLALEHSSKAIVLVHSFILKLLSHICPEKRVMEQLLEDFLIERLRVSYRRAMDHARFLLNIERKGRPTTFNHYFNANVQKKRIDRVVKSLEGLSSEFDSENRYILLRDLKEAAEDKDNIKQVCEDIADTLSSYYKVSRKRFVDSICQQVINHFLLDDEQSPVKILCSDFVMGLNDEQLEAVAGEDAATKEQRQVLQREAESLEAALKVLRSS